MKGFFNQKGNEFLKTIYWYDKKQEQASFLLLILRNITYIIIRTQYVKIHI